MANPPETNETRAAKCTQYLNEVITTLSRGHYLTLYMQGSQPNELYYSSKNAHKYMNTPRYGKDIIKNVIEISREILEINHLNEVERNNLEGAIAQVEELVIQSKKEAKIAFQH